MDLNDIKPTERLIEILSPVSKEPIGVRISLLHVDDPRMKKVRRSIQDEKNRLEIRGKYLKAEDVENNTYEIVFAAITGWEWYNPTGTEKDKDFDPDACANWKGQTPIFNKKNAFEIFNEIPWFIEQITKELDNTEAFFPR